MDYATCLATSRRLVRDMRAPDGVMAGGWRIVREGGWVRAFGAWWQHDKLLPFVGQRVWMDNTDYWHSDCTAFQERPGRQQICDLKNGKSQREDSAMINWDISPADFKLVRQIARRMKGLSDDPGFSAGAEMDVTACHLNGCELNLQKLLNFDNANFAHDVHGIRANIDRKTGVLKNCFLPRCAVPTRVGDAS